MSELANIEAQVSQAVASIDPAELMKALANPSDAFLTTVDVSTVEGKKAIYNSLSDAESLIDHVGKVIKITGYTAHPVSLISEETGEEISVLRIVLMDDKGNSYAATSKGLYSSLQRITGIFGTPDQWGKGLDVKPVEERARNGFRFLKLVLV